MNLRNRSLIFCLMPVLWVAGCGGSSSGADVSTNPPPLDPDSVNYNGPVPRTSDVAAFKSNLWDNVARADRCGACHVEGGQAPAFARGDDINLAYTSANTIVSLTSPANSQMVTRVAGGHNCWLESDDACADALTTWITNWANASIGGSAGEVDLQPPPIRDPGASRYYPESPALFETEVYPLFRNFCVDCHQPSADIPVTPYFAHADVATAYLAAQDVMNLNSPTTSRVVQRLAEDNHNCWTDDCAADAQAMADAIADMAGAITPATPPAELVVSKALVLTDGALAASGGRFDGNVIARYEFRTGSGTTAYDTSGVEPALNLNLVGDVEWVGGWGIRVNDGKAQGSTANSAKLHQLIQGSGEFSVEAWVIPSTPAQDGAHIVSYSAGTDNRNFTLAQSDARYSFALRNDNTGANGMPELDTPDEALQASLQHVVLTYDPVNGRRLYVNGEDSGSVDPVAPSLLNSWNDTYAFVLGNEVSSDRLWQGVLRFVAIHNRALNTDQVRQNFAAGVGERRYLLFSVADLIDEDNSYIGFEVSRFDNYAYLFAEPFFIDLDEGDVPSAVALEGMRLGINGKEASVGQVWTNLDIQLGGAGYSAAGQPLARTGTILPVEQGEEQDEFFLTFARLGPHSHTYTEPPAAPLVTEPDAAQSEIGMRTFDAIDASMSALTGVPRTYGDVPDTYATIRQQLPVAPSPDGFLTAHQIAVAQLAIEYCNALVEAEIANDTAVPAFFAGLDYDADANGIGDAQWRSLVIEPLVERMVGTDLSSQPAADAVTCELETLLFADTSGSAACTAQPSDRPAPASLARCGGSCPAGRTATATKAACAAALGSATLLLQ